VTPGASAAAVSKAWRTELALVGFPGGACAMTAVRVGKATGYAVFRRGRLAAVFFDAGARTDRGVRVGTTETRLRAAYGSSLVRSGRTYFLRARWQIRFDVGADGRVSRIGFGDANVRRAEGCG
jgi:hypothetical protein